MSGAGVTSGESSWRPFRSSWHRHMAHDGRRSQLLHEAKAAVVNALSPGSAAAASAVQWIYEFQHDAAHVEDNCRAALQLVCEPADSSFSSQFKLFALNSLESLIKSGWYNMSQEFREDVKRNLESLLPDASLSANFLSDALSRCVVEVMVREWPQKWPQLLPLMLSIPKSGSVLHVLWRLAEDIGVHFKPNNPQRRREILNTITENLKSILGYIWDCLQSDQSVLCLFSLKTLTAYLEWTPIESQLIRFLCHILSTSCSPENHLLIQSKSIACECLVSIVSRKKMKESETEAIAVLFTDEILSVLLHLLRQCLSACDEPSFTPMFLELSKKVCLLMTGASRFLLSGEEVAIRVNVVYSLIREMLPVFKHRNQGICHSSVDFFREILKAQERLATIKQEMHSMMRELFMTVPDQLVKADPAHVFVIHEFDSYGDYELFYIRFKEDLTNLLRLMTSIDASLTAQCMLQFLDHVNSATAAPLSKWESAVLVLDCVCNKLPQTQEYADMVLPLMMHLLTVPTQQPDLISIQLSCVSALSAFLPLFSSSITKQLVDRIFFLAKFPMRVNCCEEDQQSIKSLRRHACACFVKTSRRFPHILLPLFGQLQQELTTSNFSRMEVAALIEGLVLICNVSDEPERLKVLICQILSHIDWLKEFNVDTKRFMQLIGIAGTGEPMSEEFVTSRGKIQQAVTLLLALFRRVENKSALLPHVVPFVKAVVAIACNLNEMWDPAFRCICNPSLSEKIYSSASDLDKLHLLEYTLSSKGTRKTQAIDSKIQNFLWSVHESVFTVFGCAFSFLRPDVYSESACFLNTLEKCHFLPRMKLKLIVKHFLKPFVQNSPLEPDSLQRTIDPLFSSFLPWLFRHVDEGWDAVRAPDDQPPDEDRLHDEIINEQANRLLARELADLFQCLLLASAKGSCLVPESSDALMDVDSASSVALESDIHLSPICRHLIQKHLISLVSMTVGALIWSDSLVNQRFVLVNKLLLKELIEMRLISTVDDVSFIVHHVFLALRLFGESEQNQSALLQLTLVVYEQLAKNYGDDMRAPFSRLSQSQESGWAKFHQTLIQPSVSGTAIVNDKKKKDALRSLLSGLFVVDSHVCQKVHVKSLRPLFSHRKKQNEELIDSCDSTLSLVRLFS